MAGGIAVRLFFAFLAVCVETHEDSQQKSTGFKKVSVERKEGFLDVVQFFENFVIPRVPAVFRNESFVFVPDFGENDLATSPLSITTYVHAKKKGNANVHNHMSVRQFVNRYHKEELYLDDAIPTNIKSYVTLPKCLLCKTVFDEMLSTRLLFHHGKHEDGLLATKRNFLGCQITGTSVIHFFSPVTFPEHDSQEAQDKEEQKVEMEKNRTSDKIYLNVDKENQTYFAKLKAGDCIYIPAFWLHQWTTNGKSINVGVYWSSKRITPTSTACANQSEQNLMTLSFKDDPKPNLESLFIFDDLLHFIKNYFLKNEEEGTTFKTFEKDFQKDPKYMEDLVEWNSECSFIAREMFQQMDANDDGFLSLKDFDKLSYKDLEDMAGKIDDRLADFEDIFEDQKAEQKGSLFSITKNSANSYENELRSMINEEFDEIYREMEAAGQSAKHASKDGKPAKETVPGIEEFENMKNTENDVEEPFSQKTNDKTTNKELKTDAELKKDEL